MASALRGWQVRIGGRSLYRPSHWLLWHQLLLSSLLATLVLMVVAGVWLGELESQEHRRLYEGSLREKLALLRAASQEALVSRDTPVLTSIVEESGRRDGHILSLEIIDDDNKVLAQWQMPTPPASPIIQDMEVRSVVAGENFGRIRVVWDMSSRQEEVESHTRSLLIILALVMLVLAAILIFLARLVVVRPINIIHDYLLTEVVPTGGMSHAARELQRLGEAVTALLRLKHEIKRSELRYRGLFDNMFSSCMVLSSTVTGGFQVEDINESCRRLPALAIGAWRVASLGEIIDESEAAVLYEALRNAATRQATCHMEEFALSRAGRIYWLDCHVFPLDDGEMVLMIRDVTDLKISLDLRRAKEAAEQANELKSSFLASMSHEIRTPLNGVLSMVELLRGTRLSNKQQHWVNAIRSSGQLLLSTINDILDFSKIEAGRLHLEEVRFSLGEVIGNLFNATSQRAYGKGLELILQQAPDLPDQLIGDPFRIQQVLINLVGNAIKYTERGEVEISLEKQDIPGNRLLLRVSVRDTGVGIASGQVKRVFLPFEQGFFNRALFREGTGLGLAISKRLVDAMGGTIGVESRLGEGSLFHFEVPVGVVDVPQHSGWLIPDSWSRIPALVWVRHEAVQRSIVRALDSFGFKTHVALAAAEADEWSRGAAAADRLCLVVLDDSLIGSEGPNLLAAMEARAGAVKPYALYVVNMFNRDRGELDRLDSQPNTSYVMKPIHISSLYNVLQELFGFSSKSRAVAAKLEDPSWEMLIERLGARKHLSGARILLVEDNLVNQEVAVEALSMAGVEVQLAANGQKAIEMVFGGNRFDGVLMDLQMPVMDGFQATRLIREQYDMETLPIIAMTAGVLFRDRQRSLEVGMNDHVGKPVNMKNLMETLMKWVTPAHPRPLSFSRAGADDLPAAESALTLDGRVDWARIELPGIKIFKGLNRLGGNQKLYFKLLKSFAKAHDHTETEVLAALANRDTKTLRRLAHTVKGVATTLGADSLHDSAMIVEKEAENGQIDSLREMAEPLIVHLNEVLRSIHSFLRSIRSSERDDPATVATVASAPGTPAAGIYDEILDLLERADTRLQEVCEANSATIRAWFDGDGPYRAFMEGVEHYHFEEARDVFLSSAAVENCSEEQHTFQF